nr:MAG TPA: hypothetical protein [Caudoviricetes sp.]
MICRLPPESNTKERICYYVSHFYKRKYNFRIINFWKLMNFIHINSYIFN